MHETEQLKAAFATIAEEAPDVGGVTAALAERRRVASQRRMVLRLAGAGAAAVAIGGGVATYERLAGRRPVLPEAEQPGDAVALHTRPAWLPDGYTPSQLVVAVGDANSPEELRQLYTARAWSDGDGGTVTLAELTAAGFTPPANATTVDVGGVSAVLVAGPSGTELTWRPSGGPMVRLQARRGGSGDPEVDRPLALRIAQRLTLSPARVVVPRLGWLPPGVDGSAWGDMYVPDGYWYAGPADRAFTTMVDLGPTGLDTHADPIARTVQVRGRDGYVTRSGALVIHLADGRWLRVYETNKDAPPLSFDTARALAEGLRLAPPVDPSVF
ncbi:hypothetical protein AB0M46_19730 [Dactylosporangium sp. NPDC051485]|uniref:hypothetical protein n=1 Tax=Dactylosporangium sp. NPDC051485 TaxID=3154846 RepID=UPI003440DF87